MPSAFEDLWEDLKEKPLSVQLRVYALIINRHSEVVLHQLEQDIARMDSLDPLEQWYLWAYWRHIFQLPNLRKWTFPFQPLISSRQRSRRLARFSVPTGGLNPSFRRSLLAR